MQADSSSIAFVRRHNEYRSAVRRQSEAEFLNLIETRNTVLDQIDAYQQRVQGIPFEKTDQVPYLIAQFIQGIELSYAAIVDGLYAQAANLQKQQIETLAALEEVGLEKRIDGNTPNVQNRLPHFRAEYKNLNDVAHPARENLVVSLSQHTNLDKIEPTTIPQFRSDICNAMLSSHCKYLLNCWRYMAQNYRTTFSKEPLDGEIEALRNAIGQFISSQNIATHARS